MSLVMMSGLPSSGKSTRVEELVAYLKTQPKSQSLEICVITDEMLDIKHSEYYDRESEKKSRAKQISMVKKMLSPQRIVILDSLTYIKGFRYQLYCDAKAAKVTSCVFYVASNEQQCLTFNQTNSDKWPEDLLSALAFRYEEPNGLTRWDSPLFVAVPQDKVDYSEIYDSIMNKEPAKPNNAVLKRPTTSGDYLTVLNSTTSDIVKEVLQLHRDCPGGQVKLRDFDITLPFNLTMPQLTRIRRNFIAINKQNTIPMENLASNFIEFLTKNWEVLN